MPSPYIRRQQLAAELRKLREEHNLSIEAIADIVYQSKSKIARMETGQVRPDLAEVMTILETLGVTGSRFDRIVQLTREAAHKGWWERYGASMTPRQRMYADLEANADTIRDYNQIAMPGALQCPEFVSALIELDKSEGPLRYRPDRLLEARAKRQRQLLRPDGPTYETVLDEYVIRRLAVPPEAMAAQLKHMISMVSSEERITVRVLPHDARIAGGLLPRASFYLFTFPEPDHPSMVVLETITTDLVLSKQREIARYAETYGRLREASLSPEDSITFLDRVANEIVDQAGS